MSSEKKTQSAAQAGDGVGKVTRLRPLKPCPICKKMSTQEFHPFCTARCANVDLNRWLTGSYVIPATDDEEEDEMENFDNFEE